MRRKEFLLGSGMATAGLLLNPGIGMARAEDPDPYKVEIVKEFVIAGHGNLEKVKAMLTDYPNLLFSRYDWGNGDFEEALEGAGHVGNKEIANYLIASGARPNIYVLTMLGQTTIVKSILQKYPGLIQGKGPHGFTLLHHANKGGEDSAELKEYLLEKGLTETQIKIK